MDCFREHYILSHFAKLENGLVVQVIVVDNADTATVEGVEMESIGATFCERLLGGEWKQTSYNGKMRKNYAGIGYTYDAVRDAFIAPQPYPSWVLNEQTCRWEAPVPMPTDGKMYAWDEATLNWIESK
jgi:hypothetical protein